MRRSSATSAIEAAGESARTLGHPGRGIPRTATTGSPEKAPAGKEAAKPVVEPRAELRRELDRWCACRGFAFQFSLIAKRQPKPPPPSAKKRRWRRGGQMEAAHACPPK